MRDKKELPQIHHFCTHLVVCSYKMQSLLFFSFRLSIGLEACTLSRPAAREFAQGEEPGNIAYLYRSFFYSFLSSVSNRFWWLQTRSLVVVHNQELFKCNWDLDHLQGSSTKPLVLSAWPRSWFWNYNRKLPFRAYDLNMKAVCIKSFATGAYEFKV